MNKRKILNEMVQSIIDGDTASAKKAFCTYLTISGKNIVNEAGLSWDAEPTDFNYKFNIVGADGNKYPVEVYVVYNMMTAYRQLYPSSMDGPAEGVNFTGEASALKIKYFSFNKLEFEIDIDEGTKSIEQTSRDIDNIATNMYDDLTNPSIQDADNISEVEGKLSVEVCKDVLQRIVSDIASEQHQQNPD